MPQGRWLTYRPDVLDITITTLDQADPPEPHRRRTFRFVTPPPTCRFLEENGAAVRIARTLGYIEDGRTLEVVLHVSPRGDAFDG